MPKRFFYLVYCCVMIVMHSTLELYISVCPRNMVNFTAVTEKHKV